MASRSSNSPNVVPLHPARQPAVQLALLPLRIDAEFEAQFRTADLKKIVRAIDGHFYALKAQTEHPLLPASEFLCYRLATACQIAVPFSAILVGSDETHYFGSRFEGATTEATAAGPTIGLEMFKQSAAQVSAALAFDLFIGNEDRHRGNFLFRKNYQQQWAPLAIDYSRALLVRGFPNDVFPMPDNSHTRTTITQMKISGLWNAPQAVFSISTLQQIKVDHVERWFDEMPSTWITGDQREGLLRWWGSPAFNGRLNALYPLL